MIITAEEITKEIKTYFKDNILSASYHLFIEPLETVSYMGDELTLKAPSEWCKSIIDKRFMADIQSVTENLLNKHTTIIITIN